MLHRTYNETFIVHLFEIHTYECEEVSNTQSKTRCADNDVEHV